MAEDLRRPVGNPLVLKNDPVARVYIVASCPNCGATHGNELLPNVATAHVNGGGLAFGIIGTCDGCQAEIFTPFAAIYDELKRIGVMR